MSQAEDRDAQKLFAASGDVVFEISKDLSESPRTARISRDPLRSIRPGDDGELLLGSRGGVTRFRENSEQPPLFFADPGIAAKTGFNAAAVSSGRLWATHAEAGVVAWNIEQPQSPFLRIKDSAVPAKNLAILPSGNAIFSSGPRVLVAAPGGSLNPVGPESKAEIIALFVRPPKLLVITADGRVCVCNLQNFQLEQERHHARPVSAAALLPWLDDFRILLAEESGGRRLHRPGRRSLHPLFQPAPRVQNARRLGISDRRRLPRSSAPHPLEHLGRPLPRRRTPPRRHRQTPYHGYRFYLTCITPHF